MTPLCRPTDSQHSRKLIQQPNHRPHHHPPTHLEHPLALPQRPLPLRAMLPRQPRPRLRVRLQPLCLLHLRQQGEGREGKQVRDADAEGSKGGKGGACFQHTKGGAWVGAPGAHVRAGVQAGRQAGCATPRRRGAPLAGLFTMTINLINKHAGRQGAPLPLTAGSFCSASCSRCWLSLSSTWMNCVWGVCVGGWGGVGWGGVGVGWGWGGVGWGEGGDQLANQSIKISEEITVTGCIRRWR